MKWLELALLHLARNEDGAAAAEYAILVAFIAAAVAGAVVLFDIGGIYTIVSQNVTGWINQAPTAPPGGG